MTLPNKSMPNYVSASMILSLAGLLNGFDTGCIGSIVHMEQFAATVGRLSATLTGITVSVIMLTGILPALLGGHLADRHGRLRVILPGAVLFGLGAMLQATSFGLGQFVAGRAISGTGQGAFLANVSVYIAEVAPPAARGRLTATPQFMSALGVCVGYFGCYGTASLASSLAWRLPYIAQVVVAAMLAGACLVLPESPRWLLQHGCAQEAARALQRLDFDMAEARRDFLDQPQQQPSMSRWQSFRLLFGSAYRQRTLLALFVLSMAQLSGIDAITYVSHWASKPCICLLTCPVCSRIVQTGWHRRHQHFAHRLRCGVHHDADSVSTWLPASRRMGPASVCYQRRHLDGRPDAPYRELVCRRGRHPDQCRTVGGCCIRVPLRHGLLRHLGYLLQDIRHRDSACQHACGW